MAQHPQNTNPADRSSHQQPQPSAAPAPPKRSEDKKLDRLFSAPEATSSAKHLWGSSVLFDLLLVRPWILVGGFWLILVVTIAIAFGGLMNPGKQAAQVTAESQVLPNSGAIAPDAAATARLALEADTLPQSTDPAATLEGTSEQPVPVWPLWVMVLACAGGCFLMSRLGVPAPSLQRERGRHRSAATRTLAAHRMAPDKSSKANTSDRGVQARKTKPERVKAKTSRPKVAKARSTKAKPDKKRRQPGARRLNPQYPSAQVMTIPPSNRSIHRVMPTRAQALSPSPTTAKPVSFAMPTTPVTVVPTEASHPLDWQEGSLAHRLDVRPKRPLNSLL
jgi:hypothetical protein